MSIKQNINNKFLNENNAHVFRHKAMNTMFELFIADEEMNYAEQAAHEAFLEIDIIENDLSKFIPNSDISRINSMSIDESTVVGLHAFRSLEDCKKLYDITRGIFNVTIGEEIDKWKESLPIVESSTDNKISEKPFPFIINDTDFSITKISNAAIDLGGYGKGYAIDLLADLLKEWSIGSFLISGGSSTVLAYDSENQLEGWPVSVTNPVNSKKLGVMNVQNIALSSSGLQKGHHIIDPRKNRPPAGKAAWAACGTAAWSDAFSTTFLILNADEVSKICSEYDISALLIGKGKKGLNFKSYGKFFVEL